MNLHFISPLADVSEHDWKLLIIFAFVAVIIGMRTLSRMQRQKLWHETARAAIDKGQPLPPTFAGRYRMWGRYAEPFVWCRGLVWIAVGVGLRLVGSDGVRDWAPLPICVGAALLVIGLIQALWANKNDGSGSSSGQM